MKTPLPLLALLGLLASGVSVPAAEEPPKPAPPTPRPQREVKWNYPDGPKIPGLEHHVLKSTAMDREMGFNVWTPPGYSEGSARYPVIYFLHGAGGNENSDAGGFASMVRRAIEQKKSPPVICVFPNGGLSGYADRPDQKIMMETFLMKELLPHIDATWRTAATREGRVLCGFSMGGGGALRLAVKHPDTFSAAGSWAGAIGYRRPEASAEMAEALRANAAQIKDHVRFLLVVGDKDMTFAGHAPFLAQLEEQHVAREYKVLPGVEHNLGKYHQLAGDEMVAFLTHDFAKEPAK
jgi:endo-1,4-beta-xylanase